MGSTRPASWSTRNGIPISAPTRCHTFLDILLVLRSTPDGSARILTQLYDQRDQPGFKALRLTLFIAADSNVNLPAKRALLAGQFQRLRRVITNPDNFAFEMSRVVQALRSIGNFVVYLA
ncbi:hypothetical protein GPECTOR_108g166 [Gonium pectorale]|uniref:Uncharacterized protein n=1 Tax=Gonium pectorale TaxID=33097 RepID=A0A150FZD4_GONPE|nr:hypothetical protein GPECTOR_108g166 [Gonium pectorale]|eukprot:KXZ42971.1 hypothetical protein GPECTOR_108g166 [Gonium pectorale]